MNKCIYFRKPTEKQSCLAIYVQNIRYVNSNSRLAKVHNDGANERGKRNGRAVDRGTFQHMTLQSFKAMLAENKDLERKLNNVNRCGHLSQFFSLQSICF